MARGPALAPALAAPGKGMVRPYRDARGLLDVRRQVPCRVNVLQQPVEIRGVLLQPFGESCHGQFQAVPPHRDRQSRPVRHSLIHCRLLSPLPCFVRCCQGRWSAWMCGR